MTTVLDGKFGPRRSLNTADPVNQDYAIVDAEYLVYLIFKIIL